MSARRDDQDDEDRKPAQDEERSAAAYPLILPEGRRSLIRRMVDPLRDLLDRDDGGEAEARSAPATEPAAAEARPRDASTPVRRATLQLLPGRLQPVAPAEFDQEIRFVRTGRRETEVTLGWKEAAPPSHVRLDHPSLQPLHARMSFRDDAWSIESLSETAPVRVNDATIAVADGPRRLASGDRVRMGDVEFEFRWP